MISYSYLEDVTLDLEVELVVQVTIDLRGLTVLAEETTEDAHAANPRGERKERQAK